MKFVTGKERKQDIANIIVKQDNTGVVIIDTNTGNELIRLTNFGVIILHSTLDSYGMKRIDNYSKYVIDSD